MAIQIADRHPRLSVVVAELRRLSERREAYAGPRLSRARSSLRSACPAPSVAVRGRFRPASAAASEPAGTTRHSQRSRNDDARAS
jgi:hypothetical protein